MTPELVDPAERDSGQHDVPAVTGGPRRCASTPAMMTSAEIRVTAPWDPQAALRARVTEIELELRDALPVTCSCRHELVNAVAGMAMTLTLLDQPRLPADLRSRLESMLTQEAARTEKVLAAARRPVTGPRDEPA